MLVNRLDCGSIPHSSTKFELEKQAYWSLTFDMSDKERADYDRIIKNVSPELKEKVDKEYEEWYNGSTCGLGPQGEGSIPSSSMPQ